MKQKASILSHFLNFTSPKKHGAGFTLIELLVVIAIVGILSMIVFVNVTASRAKARDAKRVQDMHDIQTALEIYNSDCGQYPAAWALSESTGCTPPMTLGDVMPILPTDPTPGNNYAYTYDSGTNTYSIIFIFENSVNGLPPGAHTLQPTGIH